MALATADGMGLTSIDRHDLKDIPFKPSVPAVLRDGLEDRDIFTAIREGDMIRSITLRTE